MAGFNWVEGTTTVAEIVKALATDLTMATTGGWKLEYPAALSDITNVAIISTTTSHELTAYLKMERPAGTLNHMMLTVGDKLSSTGDDIDETKRSAPARYAWYRENTDITLFEWMSVQYWLSFSGDFVNVVLQGDPSVDIAPYKNYLISYAYIGTLEGFEGADVDDKYNFGMTVSSDIFPAENEMPEMYGKRTATCVTDVGMLGTRTGTPWQAHLPKFSTMWEFADRHFISSSQWTHKYHMSDIIIAHAYDRERGKMQNVLIGDRSAIFHGDILVIDKDTPDEKQYVAFQINAPYSILNNGPNVLYGIAMRKS
jgi:hypothetical protein